jgi:PemK-like, MazF-like toxin of type II toxin-antitoxin system
MVGIPDPEQGLVINYSYLWHHEHRQGHEEGRKDRPSVIVLAVDRVSDGATIVTVLAVTHTPPKDPATAVEIPATIKRHLGLDEQRSWIVVDEGNRFIWPGYDLRHVPNTDRFDYGFLPPRFFTSVQAAFAAIHKAGKAKTTPRE